MSSLAERKKVYEDYLSAVNEQNLEKVLSFYDENIQCRVNDLTVVKGKDQFKVYYEKYMASPDFSVQLLEYLPIDGDDRVRAHVKTSAGNEFDITHVFSKENPEHFIEAIGVTLSGSK